MSDEKPSIMYGLAEIVQGAAEQEPGTTFLTLSDARSLCPPRYCRASEHIARGAQEFCGKHGAQAPPAMCLSILTPIPQFANPNHLSREHRIKHTERRRKEPTMGPGRKLAQSIDVFRKLNIDPLDEFRNDLLLKSFVSEMGKINSRAKTGLTWRSQRRMGKAIRRARAMGIIPLWNQPDPTGHRIQSTNWANPQVQRNRF